MKTRMSLLIDSHRTIDRKLRRELARRVPDSLRVTRLKKRKLHIKDLLARLSVLRA